MAGTQTQQRLAPSSAAMLCEVRFRLHSNAPEEFVAAWKTMVNALTHSHEKDKVRVELHQAISQKVQATATLHKNDAKILVRHEGGFGGNMNDCDRQIRFIPSYMYQVTFDPLEIRMRPSNGHVTPLGGDPYDEDPGNHKMEWTMPDLIDFKHAAMMALNKYLYVMVNPEYPDGDLCLEAVVLFKNCGEERTAHEKEEFEFYVNNYPNKKLKKRVIETITDAERDAKREEAIDRANANLANEPEPTIYVQTYFNKCYELAPGNTSNIKAFDMLEKLKRAGYNGTGPQLNAWIRETYGPWVPHPTEKNTKRSTAHQHVMEKLTSNRVVFTGFVLKTPPASMSTSAPSAGYSWNAPVAL